MVRPLLHRLAVLALAGVTLAACHQDFAALNAPAPQFQRPAPVAPPPPPPPVNPATLPPVEVIPADPDPLVDLPATPVEPAGTAVVVIPATPAPAQSESPLLAQQRAACAREGGRMQTLTSGIVACIRQTGDAGRACTGASDCEGVCLARSGTCAPITPLYGCHEVQLAPGSRVTQCLD